MRVPAVAVAGSIGSARVNVPGGLAPDASKRNARTRSDVPTCARITTLTETFFDSAAHVVFSDIDCPLADANGFTTGVAVKPGGTTGDSFVARIRSDSAHTPKVGHGDDRSRSSSSAPQVDIRAGLYRSLYECSTPPTARSTRTAMAAIGGLGSLLASPERDWDAMLVEAISLLRRHGDDAPLAAACYSLSRHRLSVDGIDDAIDLSARTGNHWLHGWSLVNKASLLIERSADSAEILGVLDAAERVGRAHGLPVVVAGALMRRAALALLEDREGRPVASGDDTRRWADEAEHVMRSTGDVWQLHEVVFLQCRTKLHDGDLRTVPQLSAEAISVAGRCQSAPIFAEALLLGAELAARHEQHAAAARLADLAGAVTTTIWNRRWLATHRREHVERVERAMADLSPPRLDLDAAEDEALRILANL